jgi:hypothetical protein
LDYHWTLLKRTYEDAVMKKAALVRALRGLAIAVVLCGAYVSTAEAAKPPQVTEDGLELTKAKGISLLYRRPGTSLAGFTKVMIDPVQVAFDKNWDPRDYGRWGLKADQVQKIRTDLAALANDIFAKVLTEGGYPSVAQADTGVLRITAYIVDLFINAPDKSMQSSSPSRSYVINAGHMTLVMELRDAVTGTLLARALDARNASETTGRLQWSNSVSNRAEAETIIQGWANRLKKGLDSARSP